MQRLTNQKTRVLTLLVGLTSLVACGEENSGAGFYREAGAQIDSGVFGTATLQNIVAQTCPPRRGGSGKIGATLGDPVVVLDSSSTTTNPVYRVHCDGNLDGKYARVLYTDYVESAEQKTVTEQAEAE